MNTGYISLVEDKGDKWYAYLGPIPENTKGYSISKKECLFPPTGHDVSEFSGAEILP